MDFNEFLKDEKMFDKALKCKDIDEFKKLVDECKVQYCKPENVEHAWSYVKLSAPDEDGSLDDEALGSVAGGLIDMAVAGYACVVDKDLLYLRRNSSVTQEKGSDYQNRNKGVQTIGGSIVGDSVTF